MKNTIATAPRNAIAIKKRKYLHYGYRGVQEIARRLTKRAETDRAVLYPVFDDSADLVNVLNRMAWFLPEPTIPTDCEIVLSVADHIDIEAAQESTPGGQAAYKMEHLPLEYVNRGKLESAAGVCELVIIWNADVRLSGTALRNLPAVELVDPSYWSVTEAHTWGVVGDRLRSGVPNESPQVFARLEERFKHTSRSYIFGTGPSLDDAMAFDLDDDSLKIVCNSIVRNKMMLDHIDPDILVFADPVFHFGPSRYAAQFRDDAIRAIREYDCTCIIPARHLSLMVGRYPETEFMALPTIRTDSPRFPMATDLHVMRTKNIMTLYMLPVASALTDCVDIIGADGREEDESYFWEHNESAQYDDEMMRSAVETHPSFFRDRIYTDYYEDHVATLEAMLEYGERQDVRYRNLTHSYIPCLADRIVADPHEHVAADD